MNEEELEQEDREELYEHYNIVADKKQTLIRVDKFLVDRIPNTSRNKIQAAAKSGNILVNNNQVKPNYKIKPDDEISIVLPYPVREIELTPENIPIDIIYEDDDLMVINKSPDIVVHPGFGNYSGTLINALLYHFENLPHRKDGFNDRPGLVHRLDKKTSGIMVIAKTEHALSHLAKQFYDRTIDRKYQAIVWGEPEAEEGRIEGHIGRSPKNRKVMAVYEDGSYGKHAVTHYKILEKLGYVTLVECKLETGRTHQIRIHMKHIGHPLFNDEDYGGDRILKGTSFTKYKQFITNCFKTLPRQALHAKSLGFTHPTTGKQMFFESDLPDDMNEVLVKWRTYIEGRKE